MFKLKDECIALAKAAKESMGKLHETNNKINEKQDDVAHKFAISDEISSHEETESEKLPESQNSISNLSTEENVEKQEKNEKIEKLLKLDENSEDNESEEKEADDYISQLEQNQ